MASGFAPGSRVPLLIAMFQMIDVVGRFAPQCSVAQLQTDSVKGPLFSHVTLKPLKRPFRDEFISHEAPAP